MSDAREKKNDLILVVCSVLATAHNIVESCIEGKPLSANRLENYYGSWTEILIAIGREGCLIREDTFDDLRKVLERDTGRKQKAVIPGQANRTVRRKKA